MCKIKKLLQRSFFANKAPEDMPTTSAVRCLVPVMESPFSKSRWPDSFFHILNKVRLQTTLTSFDATTCVFWEILKTPNCKINS